MAIDLDAIRNRLNTLQTKVTKTDNLWKPQPGKQQIRILPYVHNTSNPFIELYFHFGFGGKNIISPSSFGPSFTSKDAAIALTASSENSGPPFSPKFL